jgi:hypothetical protein
MANKKYTDFTPNSTPALSDVILVSNPTTGALSKITLTQLQTLIGGSGGGGSTTLATPTGLTITPANTQLTISWSAVANATSYTVQDSLDGVNYFTSYEGATPSTVLSALTNGTLYYIRVKATAAGYTDSAWATGSGTPATTYDTDAQAYFTTANITDTTEKTAWNAFVVGAKSDGFWNDLQVINPLLGSAAAKTAINAKNPAQHAITWNGTVTHNADGVTGNGTNGYGNMAYNPSTQMSTSGAFACAYVVNAIANNATETFEFGSTNSDCGILLAADFANITYGMLFNQGEVLNQNSTTARTGIMILNRTSASSAKFWRNGILVEEVTGAPVGPVYNAIPNANLLILAKNNDGAGAVSFSSNTVGFLAFGGTGLNDTKRAAFETRLQTLMTALGR